MKIKIISWNVRGVNDPDKRKVIKNFLRSYRADIVCLQETKIQEMTVNLARDLGVGRRLNWKELNAEKVRGLDIEEAEERVKARADFKSWALMEEISWRQKSREIWLKEGDKNTGFFHRMANAHRRRTCLNSICINGRKLVKEEDIKEGLVDAFKNLLLAPGGWSPSLPDLNLNRIGSVEAASLEEKLL